jgi:hypothetical protein
MGTYDVVNTLWDVVSVRQHQASLITCSRCSCIVCIKLIDRVKILRVLGMYHLVWSVRKVRKGKIVQLFCHSKLIFCNRCILGLLFSDVLVKKFQVFWTFDFNLDWWCDLASVDRLKIYLLKESMLLDCSGVFWTSAKTSAWVNL